MMKFIALFFLAGILPTLSLGQLVFTDQTITVLPDQLTVESVEFHAEAIITNSVAEWITTNVIYLGGATENYATATNTVQQQVLVDVVTTNSAQWICNVIFELPSGYAWELNGLPVMILRFKTELRIPVAAEVVSATFGPAAAGLEFAAANGAYTPTGLVRDAFLSFAAAVLAGGEGAE